MVSNISQTTHKVPKVKQLLADESKIKEFVISEVLFCIRDLASEDFHKFKFVQISLTQVNMIIEIPEKQMIFRKTRSNCFKTHNYCSAFN